MTYDPTRPCCCVDAGELDGHPMVSQCIAAVLHAKHCDDSCRHICREHPMEAARQRPCLVKVSA